MSGIYLYDDACARTFQPFALTRPSGEMRAGALLVRERWALALGLPVLGHITAPHLTGFEESGAPPVLTSGSIPEGSWLVNARYAPGLTPLEAMDAVVGGKSLAAIQLHQPVDIASLTSGEATLGAFLRESNGMEPLAATSGWWMSEVWDYIGKLQPMLEHDIPILGARYGGGSVGSLLPQNIVRVGEHPIYVEEGAVIEGAVCFDTTAGPILIRKDAHIQAFTRLVGPLYVGVGSTVTADRIAASSIGDVCKVHGELSSSIFIGHANKGHDGFVGHSILGRWVNLGAGTITSNLKNTYGTVQLWTTDGVRETGLQFLGTLFGDHAKTGIGLTLTTGTVLGTGANVYGSVMPPKVVAPFSWGEADAFSDFRLDKFLQIAERVMARRHVEMSASTRAQLTASHAARWKVDE